MNTDSSWQVVRAAGGNEAGCDSWLGCGDPFLAAYASGAHKWIESPSEVSSECFGFNTEWALHRQLL